VPQHISFCDWCRQYGRYFVTAVAAFFMLAGGIAQSLGLPVAVFQVLAVLTGFPPILFETCNALKQYQLDVTLLVSIAVFAAVWHRELFDAALVVLLFNLATVIEGIAVQRVARSLRAVMQLQAVRTAHLAKSGKVVQVSELQLGDVISLRPGEDCPGDGIVVKGAASCSEAALTGEVKPVEKLKDGIMSSGTLVLNGYLEVELVKPLSESYLSEIEANVEEAQAKRTARQMMIGRFARIWTPLVLLMALGTSMLPFFMGGSFDESRHRAIVLLLTACPCAIVIGAPLATTCAIAAAASRGVLIKGPETVERLPAISTVALDKTGTLTKGEMCVVDVQQMSCAAWQQNEALQMAAALEMKSAHPIAAAIVSKALGCIAEAHKSKAVTEVKKFRSLPGVGVQGVLLRDSGAAVKVLLGNSKALDMSNADSATKSQFFKFCETHPADTTVALIIDGVLQFGLALNDALRPEAVRMVKDLHALHLQPYMLTGDTDSAAMHISEAVGLDPGSCCSSMSPEQKLEWVETMQAAGRKILMLGDGINDATALAVASVGIAIGETGAALAAHSADAVLMTDKLQRLPQCIQMCRYAVRIEQLNIALPCVVKVFQGYLAVYGGLDLWMAVLADLGTLLAVLVLGVTILSSRFWTDPDVSESFTASLSSNSRPKQSGSEFVSVCEP